MRLLRSLFGAAVNVMSNAALLLAAAIRRTFRVVGAVATRLLRIGLVVLLPTLVTALVLKRRHHPVSPEELLAIEASWEEHVQTAGNDRQLALRQAVPTIYQTTVVRFSSLEAKAIGAVQAAAVVAVGSFFALGGGTASLVLAAASLLYLATSVVAAALALLPGQRRLATMQLLRTSPTDPLIELATAAEAMDTDHVHLPNLVTSALYDLARAALLVAAALATMLI